ncbi:glycosyltransferase family 2 protein [Vibrio fluvialis]|uniref:glycosyltransferase family 2 protein n=1 Tax=Vibrio fluvialis TaxID=676 RepID=UPI002ACAD657|nr:glycosyltransferase [Vibrio fluvialis]MDZ5515755.1 glycosyltransferase [Vibrio fluvialis]
MNNFKTRAPSKFSEILCNRNLQLIHRSAAEFDNAEVLIAIPHKNQPEALTRALNSALTQTLVKLHIARIVVLNDSSNVTWPSETEVLLHHPSVTLLSAECGSPARARNLLLDWADTQPNLKWIARLDSDDELFEKNSLAGLWSAVQGTRKIAAIGSNKLRKGEDILQNDNIAVPDELNNHTQLAGFIENFASGKQSRELPSCNLLLKTGLGLRYPNIRSAEDHWLVTRLLMLYPKDIAICPFPIYAIYSLDGEDTKQNKFNDSWQDQRNRLAYVARTWSTLLTTERHLLGMGMEGAVWLQHNQVVKEFYPWAISDSEVQELRSLLSGKDLPVPEVRWRKCDGLWQYQTAYENSTPPQKTIPKPVIIHYLKRLYHAGVSTLNIKRDNLLITSNGELQYIDIGKDIKPMTTSYFRDMCARLYSIGILGNKDEELVRRKSWRRQDDALKELPGFEQFYSELITSLHPQCSEPVTSPVPVASFKSDSVTLLIKACGQDAEVLTAQVKHIVTQLSYPVAFAKTILLIDPHQGKFLRQYADDNLTSVIQQAITLEKEGLIDKVLVAPSDSETIIATYKQWFAQSDCTETHTSKNAPLFPQIWGLDQVTTPYVLQCDLDVLIGRRNWQHDYIADMIYACEPQDVLAVGFNIPKSSPDFNPYHGKPGEFAPEVRFGLLDLNRIHNQLPIDNPLFENRLTLTWHRALQAEMRRRGLRAVRGGDPHSYYVHPLNEHKHLPELSIARDMVAQGKEPAEQCEEFDWVPGKHWKYEPRLEAIVFLLKGRYTEHALLKRCLDSLRSQTNQNFGIILIDDASGADHNWSYPMLLGELQTKTTLVRRSAHTGRMPNFLLAIKEICQDPQTFIAVLDQDDCLMQTTAVEALFDAKRQGADLIQMPMYRPNKPLTLYRPDYTNPRQAAGANVWSHLRVFTKELFEQVPEDYFKHKDRSEWFDTVTDYLTMLPMAELAKNPVYLDSGYTYWHLRKNFGQDDRKREDKLIKELLSMPSLSLQKQKLVERMPEPFEDD